MSETAAKIALVRAAAKQEAPDSAWDAIVQLATEMDRGGRARHQPRRAIFALLGDRWSMLILLVLETGRWRHATLKRIVGTLSIEGAISQRMLTLKLRELQRNGLVERTATDDVPPHVQYELSRLGRELMAQVAELAAWISANLGALNASRAAYSPPDS